MKRIIFGVALALGIATIATVPVSAAAPRVVNADDTVVLYGNVNPQTRAANDAGPAALSLPMERMILALRLAPDKQARLDSLLAEQQDPRSANFHRWLTPEEFGQKFGPTPDDIQAVIDWLAAEGFAVDEVARSGMWINFSGVAAQVEHAFRTQIREYQVDGKRYHANAGNPSIPRALADVVGGVVTLHDFPRKPMNTGARRVVSEERLPSATFGTDHYLSPGDFAIIYNLNPLYISGVDGSGQTIAIVGRTHPPSSNWATFRSTMALPPNPPIVVINGVDPGNVSDDEEVEADLDVEWSGAVARNATIKLVISQSTSTTDGVDLSAQYIVDHNLAAVMSTSFGACEADIGTSNVFYANLWAQAAAQGITSFVSSGDSGASGCEGGGASVGTGLAVNGLASTPNNVAVGGTQFHEGVGTYWNNGNGPGLTSAKGYIPEVVWNESAAAGGTNLWATGGGRSSIYSKPSWQVSPGVPADGMRDIPDVSLTAAGHDGYLVQTIGSQGIGLYIVGGTSGSSPSLAGLMALIVQKTGQRQGNANIRFYQLGNAQYGASGVAVFHDTVTGNNSVPGVAGYSATTGYDLSTGLGSVDAAALVGNWGGPSLNPTITTLVSSANPVTHGTAITFTASVTGTALTGTVGFSDNGGAIAGCGSVALTGSGGTRSAACVTNGLTQGSHAIVARYSGDAVNAVSQGNLTETVQANASSLSLSSSANPSSLGATVAFTATVTGVLPTGIVIFTDAGLTVSGCAGISLTGAGDVRTATCNTSGLGGGSHPITASYVGDGGNLPSSSAVLMQTVVAPVLPGTGTIVANLYGALTVQGATLNGNTISALQPNVTIELGTTAGTVDSFAEIDFQGLSWGPGTTLTVRSGAAGQTLRLVNTTAGASAIGGALVAQGGNGAAAPVLYLRNPGGFAIAPSGTVSAPSGLTVDALGSGRTTGQDIANAGSLDGGASLALFGANIKGGGAFKGNGVLVSTFGNANNPVNGAHFLANGLQLFPGTGSDVFLTINDYGNAPQFLNFMVNGNAHVAMPSAWPGGVTLPPNNPPVPPGGMRPASVPDPSYGASSMIVQASGALTLVGGVSNDFVFAGGIALKSQGTLDLNGVVVDQGWTTSGQAFQGMFFESPNIVSNAGNIQVLSNDLNWVNFSTLPHAPVRTWTLVRAADGSANYVTADSIAPHLNTYSILIDAAANGQCWTCLVNNLPVNMY